MISYNLGKQLDANRIIKDINNLIGSQNPEVIKRCVLVIKLQEIVDYEGDSPLPKIEYKSEG